MRHFLILYRKELKSILAVSIAIVVLIFAMYVLEFFSLYLPEVYQYRIKIDGRFKLRIRYNDYMYHLVRASIYMMPAILAFSLNTERKTGTGYQILSLPVKPSRVMLAKLMAVVSVGSVVAALCIFRYVNLSFYLYGWMQGYIIRDPSLGGASITNYFNYVVYRLSRVYYLIPRNFLSIFFFCSLVCFAHAVMNAIKRYRMWVWIVTFIDVFALFVFTGKMIYGEYYGGIRFGLFPSIASVVLLALSVWLTDRYSEV